MMHCGPMRNLHGNVALAIQILRRYGHSIKNHERQYDLGCVEIEPLIEDDSYCGACLPLLRGRRVSESIFYQLQHIRIVSLLLLGQINL